MEKAKKSAKSVKKVATDNKSASEPKISDLIVPNVTFTLTVPAETVAVARQKGLARAQKTIKIDGFRPGKVPLKIVEERLGPQGIFELIVEDILTKAYTEHIKTNSLSPLTEPEVTPKSMEEGKDWVFEVAIAVSPELELGDYASFAKAAPKSEHGDHDGHDHSSDELRQIRLQEILKALLANIKVTVPELLVRRETEHRLTHLGNQLTRVNVTLDDYLKNINKTREELQQEYAISTFASLQVEFLLAAVIKAANLVVPEKELEELVKLRLANRKSGEQITREEVNYLHSSLLKQKAIEHLLSL